MSSSSCHLVKDVFTIDLLLSYVVILRKEDAFEMKEKEDEDIFALQARRTLRRIFNY